MNSSTAKGASATYSMPSADARPVHMANTNHARRTALYGAKMTDMVAARPPPLALAVRGRARCEVQTCSCEHSRGAHAARLYKRMLGSRVVFTETFGCGYAHGKVLTVENLAAMDRSGSHWRR